MEKDFEHFDDSEYESRVFGKTVDENVDEKTSKRREKAFDVANNCRKDEIDRFWTRGTYFWAFILGSYSAHFVVLGKVPEYDLCNIGSIHRFLLLITSFCAFFFSLSWFMVNRGSKFWQENWEEIVYRLEEKECGKLFHTFIDSGKHKGMLKGYDYSVSKVTIYGSIVLSVISGMILLYDVFLVFRFDILDATASRFVISLIVLFGMFLTIVFLFLKCKGIATKKTKNESDKEWKQIKD